MIDLAVRLEGAMATCVAMRGIDTGQASVPTAPRLQGTHFLANILLSTSHRGQVRPRALHGSIKYAWSSRFSSTGSSKTRYCDSRRPWRAGQLEILVAELLDPPGLGLLLLGHLRIDPLAVAAEERAVADVADVLLRRALASRPGVAGRSAVPPTARRWPNLSSAARLARRRGGHRRRLHAANSPFSARCATPPAARDCSNVRQPPAGDGRVAGQSWRLAFSSAMNEV